MFSKRYCLQRLVNYDQNKKLAEWVTTKHCSNDLSALYPILTEESRIWDTLENKVVKVYGV